MNVFHFHFCFIKAVVTNEYSCWWGVKGGGGGLRWVGTSVTRCMNPNISGSAFKTLCN